MSYKEITIRSFPYALFHKRVGYDYFIMVSGSRAPHARFPLHVRSPAARTVVRVLGVCKSRPAGASAFALRATAGQVPLRGFHGHMLLEGRTKSVRSVLVYDGELAPEIAEDDFFDYLVPIERMFGL